MQLEIPNSTFHHKLLPPVPLQVYEKWARENQTFGLPGSLSTSSKSAWCFLDVVAKTLNRDNLSYSVNLKLCSQLIEHDMVLDVEIRAHWDKIRPPQAVVSKGCDLLGEVGKSVHLANLLLACSSFFLPHVFNNSSLGNGLWLKGFSSPIWITSPAITNSHAFLQSLLVQLFLLWYSTFTCGEIFQLKSDENFQELWNRDSASKCLLEI